MNSLLSGWKVSRISRYQYILFVSALVSMQLKRLVHYLTAWLLVQLGHCSRLHLRLNFAYCAWLGSVAKTINFHGYGTSRDQRGGLTDPFHDGLWSCLPQIHATQLAQPPHAIHKVQTQLTVLALVTGPNTIAWLGVDDGWGSCTDAVLVAVVGIGNI